MNWTWLGLDRIKIWVVVLFLLAYYQALLELLELGRVGLVTFFFFYGHCTIPLNRRQNVSFLA